MGREKNWIAASKGGLVSKGSACSTDQIRILLFSSQTQLGRGGIFPIQ